MKKFENFIYIKWTFPKVRHPSHSPLSYSKLFGSPAFQWVYLANHKVRNENYDDNNNDEDDADDDGDHDRDNQDDERDDDDMDGDRVLDGLPGGHPDELALLTQVAAARPEVLMVYIWLIIP